MNDDNLETSIAGDCNISINDSNDITIEIDSDQAALDPNSVYIGSGAAAGCVIDLSAVSTSNYSITTAAAGSGAISGGGYNWGNFNAAGNITIGSFEFDDTRSTDIVIRRNNDTVGIKLLATLELWSDILGLPLVRDGEFNHEMLNQIHKDWVEAAKAGKRKESKKLKEQFDMFDQLTKNDKKDKLE